MKPTIEELEKLLKDNAEGAVEITPDGSVCVLTPIELLAKNLNMSREANSVLRQEINRLKNILVQITVLATD